MVSRIFESYRWRAISERKSRRATVKAGDQMILNPPVNLVEGSSVEPRSKAAGPHDRLDDLHGPCRRPPCHPGFCMTRLHNVGEVRDRRSEFSPMTLGPVFS